MATIQVDDMVRPGRDWYTESRWHDRAKDAAGDARSQDITYFMRDGARSVKAKDNVHIDFVAAEAVMRGMGCGKENHFIGFTNNNTGELLQFLRLEENLWHADVPIRHGAGWDGYYWGCRAGTEDVISMLGLFFEEARWFDSLNFTMRRYKK